MSALKAGDKVVADGGFAHTDCKIFAGTVLEVVEQYGQIGMRCAAGFHGFDGQISLEDGDHVVGLWPI